MAFFCISLQSQYLDYNPTVVEKLDGIARRAAKVRHAFARTHPSAKVVAMCREAYQTYIHGYHAASAALIRSILEAQLKECLGCEVGELSPLNKRARAEGLYGPLPQQLRHKIWHKVDDVRRRANLSVHNAKTPSESKDRAARQLGSPRLCTRRGPAAYVPRLLGCTLDRLRVRRDAGRAERLYIIESPTFGGTWVYTKGTVRRKGEAEVFYVFISSKLAE